MSVEKTLVDTNLLVYAFQPGEPRHEKAVAFLDQLMAQGQGVVSAQNMAEFCSLATEKFPSTMPIEQARLILQDISKGFEVISYDGQTVSGALGLSAVYEVHFFDSLLAATMDQNGIRTIATENEKDFKKIPWLKVVNPFK